MAEQMNPDVRQALEKLAGKQKEYDNYWRYYDGDHPLMYSTERLRQLFANLDVRFTENWASVVVDAVADRMDLVEFRVAGNDALTDILNDLFAQTEMALDAHDVHLGALVTGESFVVAWPTEGGEVEAYYNDSRNVHVEYDPERPRLKAWAAKWWVDKAKFRHLTLYYPDRLEKYVSREAEKDGYVKTDPLAYRWDPASTEGGEDNPFGVIPVFHFRRERRAIRSELKNVLSPQDAINKLFSDMMVVAESGAFPQRYIIGQAGAQSDLKNAPNEIWFIPPTLMQGEQHTEVGQFDPADLEVYLKAIDKIATAAAVTTRTPKHYFFDLTRDASGEALIAMEAPLVKKVNTYLERVKPTWRNLAAFLLLLHGHTDFDVNDIIPVFRDPRTIQPKMQAEIMEAERRTGLPLVTVVRRAGFSDAEIEQLKEDLAEEKEEQASLAEAAMAQALRRFDQGGGPKPPNRANTNRGGNRGGNDR